MTISVRMDPLLEKELEMAAKRQGVTKSQFVIDAVERALGHKDPLALLQQVREEFAPYHANVAQSAPELSPLKQRVRDAVRAKHQASLADWQAFQDEKQVPKPGTPQ
jgi:predicted DNA-binding protein